MSPPKHIIAHTRLAITDSKGVLRASEEGEQLEVGKHVTEEEARQFVAAGLAAGVKAAVAAGPKPKRERKPRASKAKIAPADGVIKTPIEPNADGSATFTN